MWPNPQETADLVTFTKEILIGKLQFLCSAIEENNQKRSFQVFENLFKISIRTV